MPSRTQVRSRLLALGLWLTLAAGCQFTKVEDDVLYACESDGSCGSSEQVCSRRSLCIPRSEALRILQPENNLHLKGPTVVEVILDAAGVDPETLTLTVTKQGGATSTVTLTRQEEGRYTGLWSASGGEGTYELRVQARGEGFESPPLTIVVDNESPAFNVVVPQPPGPPSQGALTLRDPDAPTAWRRDESVVIQVISDDNDIDAASVRLVVVGAGASGDGPALAPVTPQRQTACAQAYCGTVELDLSVPQLSRFRGAFKLQVTGRDQGGNAGSGSGEVQVTRWKWELNAERDIVTSVAIGRQGRVYLGTRREPTGQVLRVRPDGIVEQILEVEAPYDALSVGPSLVDGSEVLFLTVAASESQPPKLIAIKASDGQLLAQCNASAVSDRGTSRFVVGSGLASDGSLKDVAFVGFFKQDAARLELVSLRLGDPTAPCVLQSPVTEGSFSSLVTDGRRFYYSGDNTHVVTVEAAGIQEQNLGQCNPGAARLALIGPELIASRFSDGAGTRIDPQTGVCRGFELGGSAGINRVSTLAIDAQSRLFYGKIGDNGQSFVAHSPLEPGGSTPGTVERDFPGTLAIAPILGQGDFVYTSSTTGRQQALTRALVPAWEAPQLQGFRGITGMDCARNAEGQPQPKPGVWYMAHGTRLRALIVDSHGLDTDAKWPKGQRDPRNSGNSSVDLKQFACP